jgi:hypothetical protein
MCDLSTRHQPMSNEDDSVRSVFLGGIHKYQALDAGPVVAHDRGVRPGL